MSKKSLKIPKGGNQNSWFEGGQTTQWPNKKSLKIPKGGNQNQWFEGGQTTQWPKEKAQKGQTTIYKTYI
jgi:hypothetical protein